MGMVQLKTAVAFAEITTVQPDSTLRGILCPPAVLLEVPVMGIVFTRGMSRVIYPVRMNCFLDMGIRHTSPFFRSDHWVLMIMTLRQITIAAAANSAATTTQPYV